MSNALALVTLAVALVLWFLACGQMNTIKDLNAELSQTRVSLAECHEGFWTEWGFSAAECNQEPGRCNQALADFLKGVECCQEALKHSAKTVVKFPSGEINVSLDPDDPYVELGRKLAEDANPDP